MQKQARRALGLSAFLLCGALGSCGASEAPARGAPGADSPAPVEGANTASVAPESPLGAKTELDPSAEPPAGAAGPSEPSAELTPAAQPALRFGEIPRRAPVSAALLAHAREVGARNPELFAGRVAKLGGSSIESRAFLHCFDSDEVELAGRESLRPTLEAFRRPAAGERSFSRESLATKVGWSIRHGMSGRPPYVHRELTALKPRWALAFFGSNDVQGKNDQRFAERLDDLILEIEGRGVVPVLGSLSPRGDRRMNEWVERYNRVIWGLAEVHKLPFIDFYSAQLPLKDFGLAADGVHPNVFVRRARGLACDFSAEGLEHGYNQRNLLVLETLDSLRRAYAGEAEPTADAPAPVGEGTVASPVQLTSLPFAHRVDMPEGAASTLGSYACGRDAEGAGPEAVYRVRVDVPTRISVTSYGFGGVAGRVFVLGAEPDPATCAASLGEEGELTLAPGVHHLVVEGVPERRAYVGSSARSALFVITGAPVPPPAESPAAPPPG